jgi:hypothetical protein
MATDLIVGASSSSWRDGDGNTDEAPPVERGILFRRMPLPASLLLHCWSLMVQVVSLMVVTVPLDPQCELRVRLEWSGRLLCLRNESL